MKGSIKRSRCFAIVLFGWLVLALPAQGASFDCAKAQSKVEKMICADAELSRLDEEIAKVYGEVLKKSPDEVLLKKQQRGWLKARNRCKNISCLSDHYRGRLAVLNEANIFKDEESYTLLMSKDDELCNHMLELFNQDIKQYGWRGDEHHEEHEEFKRVPWEPARFLFDYYGYAQYRDVEGALFDFNNDGVQDFVVRWKASLSNARADSLSMLGSEMSKRANNLTSEELWEVDNQISLAGNGYFYDQIAHLSEMDADPRGFDPRVFEPFIYRDSSYLVMRNLFEDIRDHAGYAVIAKYGGGKFVGRDVTGKMDNICYFKRIGAKRIY